jgi:hypothetical protein
MEGFPGIIIQEFHKSIAVDGFDFRYL